MILSDDQWAVAQSWVGEETREEFTARFVRLKGDLDAAVEESLRSQLNDLVLGQAARISVEDISIDYSSNIASLREMLKSLSESGGLAGFRPSVTRMERQTYR